VSRTALQSTAVSTHSGLPAPSPSRTSSHATQFFCSTYTMQTPVEHSERLSGCGALRARANPLFLEVWHLTPRFALPGVGLATPVDVERRAVTGLDPKTTSVVSGISRPRPRDLTMPEYRSNKTTHQREVKAANPLSLAVCQPGSSPLGSLCLELGWPPQAGRLLCSRLLDPKSTPKELLGAEEELLGACC